MRLDTIYIYTDASFSKSHALGVTGHCIFLSPTDHEEGHVEKIQFHLCQIQEKNNIRCELRAAITALAAAPRNNKVVLYSDCQTVTQLLSRREKLEREQFMSQSKNSLLANADLYMEFYALYDLVQPDIVWVPGHTSADKRHTTIHRNFSFLDKKVRAKLRELIESKQGLRPPL